MGTAVATTKSTWYDDVPRNTTPATMLGFGVIITAVLGFGLWGSLAPIAGAVVTSGTFVARGQNRIIQHLEGGVIREIRVRDGDVVEAGQSLVLLDETGPRAELQRLQLRQIRFLASEARARAEITDTELEFPPEVRSRASDPEVAAIMSAQQLAFDARRTNFRGEVAALAAGIEGLEERIRGSQHQQEAVRQQIRLIEQELADKRTLLQQGLVRRPEVLALERARANLLGEIGRLTGDIGESRERITRTREQIAGVRNVFVRTAVEQLQEARAELNDLAERIRAQNRILERIDITSPARGIVTGLRYYTTGGVIEPGRNIVEIVPVDEELVIEARVRPQDIDTVRQGQSAVIRLTALNQRVTPTVDGEVIYVSADALPDVRRNTAQAADPTRPDVFVVRVKMSANAAHEVPGFVPTPGMPAEVYIRTTERSFFDYLTRPIRDTFFRAFREN